MPWVIMKTVFFPLKDTSPQVTGKASSLGRAVLSNPVLYHALNSVNLFTFLKDLHLQQDPLAPFFKKEALLTCLYWAALKPGTDKQHR